MNDRLYDALTQTDFATCLIFYVLTITDAGSVRVYLGGEKFAISDNGPELATIKRQ